MARISVALATYNGERFLEDQLDSLAAQRHPPLELHVGDDGSTDGTIPLLERFARKAPFPVFVHRNPQRLGVTANFKATAYRCSGDWIAFCDQDDVWLPHKLSAVAAGIARAGPDLALVAHNAMVTDQALAARNLKTHWWGSTLRPRLTLPPQWSSAGFCQIFHRRLIHAIPWIDEGEGHRDPSWNTHDRWIAGLAVATGSVLLLGEALALYRRHGANVTPEGSIEEASRMGWLKRAWTNHGAVYQEQVLPTLWTARLWDEAADGAREPEMAALLIDAARRARIYGDHLAGRASVYREPRLGDRLRAVKLLFAAGGYRRSRVCSFGPRALVKDLAYASLMLGRRGRR